MVYTQLSVMPIQMQTHNGIPVEKILEMLDLFSKDAILQCVCLSDEYARTSVSFWRIDPQEGWLCVWYGRGSGWWKWRSNSETSVAHDLGQRSGCKQSSSQRWVWVNPFESHTVPSPDQMIARPLAREWACVLTRWSRWSVCVLAEGMVK